MASTATTIEGQGRVVVTTRFVTVFVTANNIRQATMQQRRLPMLSARRLLALVCCLVVVLSSPPLVSARTSSTTTATGAPKRINSPEKNALDVFVSTIRNARHHLAAAAVARSVSIFAMYPVDTIKVCFHTYKCLCVRLSECLPRINGNGSM